MRKLLFAYLLTCMWVLPGHAQSFLSDGGGGGSNVVTDGDTLWTISGNTVSLSAAGIDTLDFASGIAKFQVIIVDTTVITADSLTSNLRINPAAGFTGDMIRTDSPGTTTKLFGIDYQGNITATGKLGIDMSSFSGITTGLAINQGNNNDDILQLHSDDVSTAFSAFPSTLYGSFKKSSSTAGGLSITGITDNVTAPLKFISITSSGLTTVGGFDFASYQKAGSGYSNIGDNNLHTRWTNSATLLMSLLGDGSLGVGTISPLAKLHVEATEQDTLALFRGGTVTDDSTAFFTGEGGLTLDGALTVGGDVQSDSSAYGFAWASDSTITITISADSTWYPITNATNTLMTITTDSQNVALSNDTLTVDVDGVFKIDMDLSGAGPASSVTWEYGLELAGSVEFHKYRTTATNSVGDMKVTALKRLSKGDTIVPVVSNLTGTEDFTVRAIGITLIKVAP